MLLKFLSEGNTEEHGKPGRGLASPQWIWDPRSDTTTLIERDRKKKHLFFMFGVKHKGWSVQIFPQTPSGLCRSPGRTIQSPGGVPLRVCPILTVHASMCTGVFLVHVISQGAGC